MLKSHPFYRFPDFRRLFLGRITSAMGDKIFTIALAWWMIQRNETAMLGVLMAINVAPLVIFGPLMGTLADRSNRKTCMMAADLLRALLVFGLWVLFQQQALSTGLLLSLVFLTGSLTPLFEGSASSSLMELTDGQDLDRVVAMDSMVLHLSAAVGAFAGSVFLAWVGIGGAFLLYSITFLVSLSFIARIRKDLTSHSEGEAYFAQLKGGFSYLKDQKPLLSLLIFFAVLNFFAAPLVLFIPMMVKHHLQTGVHWFALLEGALALGSVLTSLAMSVNNPFKRAYPTLACCLLGSALLTAAMAYCHHRYLLMALVMLSGVSLSIVNTLAISRFQAHVPDAMKGRFFAILNTLCFAAMPLAFLVNGQVLEVLSLRQVMSFNAFGILILCVSLLFIPRLEDPTDADECASDLKASPETLS